MKYQAFDGKLDDEPTGFVEFAGKLDDPAFDPSTAKEDSPIVGDADSSGGGLFDDLFLDDGRMPLPADVKPSRAGAGRGVVNAAMAADKQPLRQMANADTALLERYDQIDSGDNSGPAGPSVNAYIRGDAARRIQLRKRAGQTFITESKVSARPAPKPYKSKVEALDDAVNFVEEGADVREVVASFAKLGIKPQEIAAHGKKRGSPYFAGHGVMPSEDAAPVKTVSRMSAIEPTLAEEYAINPVMRGVAGIKKAGNVLGYETGVLGVDSAASGIAKAQRQADKYQVGSDVRRGQEEVAAADKIGAWEGVKSLASNPSVAFAGLVESVVSSAPVMAAFAAGTVVPGGGMAATYAASGANE